MTDAAVLEESFLYRLSLSPALSWFDHVFLLASQQDKYVPFHSARLEMCREAVLEQQAGRARGRLYEAMVSNVLRGIEHVSLKRFDVHFVNRKGGRGGGLDSLIGRAAHIFFLDQIAYMQLLLTVYKSYLQ